MLAENPACGFGCQVGPKRPSGALEFNDARPESQLSGHDRVPVAVDDEATNLLKSHGLRAGDNAHQSEHVAMPEPEDLGHGREPRCLKGR